MGKLGSWVSLRYLFLALFLASLPSCGFMWITNARSRISGGLTLVPHYTLGGQFTTYNGISEPYVVKLNSNGSLDASFGPTGTGVGGPVFSVLVDASSRVIPGGFGSYNGTFEPSIMRLLSDGSLDGSFGPTGAGLNNAASALAFTSSGQIIVGGTFSNYNGTSEPRVARLNSDGSLDGSFAPTGAGITGGFVNFVAIDSSGKVVVGGGFTAYNGTSEPFIARLNTNGSLDGTFGPTGTGLSGAVNSIAFDSSQKLIVGSNSFTYNGTSVDFISRLNTNGSLDATFLPTGTGLSGMVNSVAIDSAGKIVVGGQFTDYNGTSEPYVARLNANGSLDATFTPTGTGLDNFVNFVAIEASGKILVGGTFTSYNGTPTPHFARLNSNGSLDTSFTQTGSGLDNQVNSIVVTYTAQ